MFGVNLAGAEFGNVPGALWTDYTYPTEAELRYYAGKGCKLIRLPFRWERLQKTLGAPLDPAELWVIHGLAALSHRLGMKLILDCHNYGRYNDQLLDAAQFAGFWSLMAAALEGNPGIEAYGLMNEPHDMPAGAWAAAAQRTVNAIRSEDDATAVYVAGDGWSHSDQFAALNPGFPLFDPADNLVYEAHCYFDGDQSGRYQQSFKDQGAYLTIGVDRVQPFAQWCKKNGVKGFIGEFSVPGNDASWLVTLDNFCAYLARCGIGGAYWAGGPWWGDNPISIEPKNGIDAPQMSVLQHYLQAP